MSSDEFYTDDQPEKVCDHIQIRTLNKSYILFVRCIPTFFVHLMFTYNNNLDQCRIFVYYRDPYTCLNKIKYTKYTNKKGGVSWMSSQLSYTDRGFKME